MSSANRRRPRRATNTRVRRVNLSLSDAEFDTIHAAAAADGLAVGAYAARSAVAVAQGDIMPIPVDERQLLSALADSRAQVRRIGNNLNQIARALNSDEEVSSAQLAAVLSRVEETVVRLDSATIDLMGER